MKHLFQILLLLVFTAGYSQYKISGYVTNSRQQNIQGAIIHMEENNAETKSDTKGYFEFLSVHKGTHKIIFQALGYDLKTVSISTLTSEITLNVELVEKAQHLDAVIVSTFYNKIQSQNVMKVEHASLNELNEKGSISLIDGLTNLPGVSQISTGNSIGKPVIRGLSGNRVLVYSQGVRMENQQFGEEHGLGLNSNGIESVEVIKGPASLLYGSDALGGVVYFNPEKYAPQSEQMTHVEQTYFTNTQGTSTSLGYKITPSKFKFLAQGNFTSHADYKIPSGNKITNTRFIEKDFKAGMGYSNSKFATDFRYNYNQLHLGLPEATIENSGLRTPLFPQQKVANHLLSVNQKIYFKNSKIEADFGYSINDRKEIEAPDEVALSMQLQTASYALKYFMPKKNRWEHIFGMQGMRQNNTNFGAELLIPNAQVNDFGIFATTNYSWNSSVLQGGIRYDSRNISTAAHGIASEEGYFEAVDKHYSSLNASLGYKTNVSRFLTTRINVASGFRAPNLAELTSNGIHEGSNRFEIGNAALKNEQNFQVDVNIEYKSEHVEVFANGFYNHIDQYIYIQPTGAQLSGNDVYQYVQNNAQLYGSEIGIHVHPHPFDWLHITSSFENVIGTQADNFLPLIPANQWKNNIQISMKNTPWYTDGFIAAFFNYTFKQNKIGVFETQSNDYLLVNLALGGKISWGNTRYKLRLNANNVFDKTYINHLSRFKNDGIVTMGRNILIAVNFDL
jgi:iron complex outermembrane receptor protein